MRPSNRVLKQITLTKNVYIKVGWKTAHRRTVLLASEEKFSISSSSTFCHKMKCIFHI